MLLQLKQHFCLYSKQPIELTYFLPIILPIGILFIVFIILDRLARGARLAVGGMRQEAFVAIGPQPSVQVIHPLGRPGPHHRPPAPGQRLFQQFGQHLVQPGALQVVEPDVANGFGHAYPRIMLRRHDTTSAGWVIIARCERSHRSVSRPSRRASRASSS